MSYVATILLLPFIAMGAIANYVARGFYVGWVWARDYLND